MLEIKPCTAKKKIAEYCRKCGKLPDESFYLYLALNRDELLAAALFEVGGESVKVLLYEAADEADHWLFDGMLRAGFNYAYDHGLATGCVPEAFRLSHRNLFAKLNYPVTAEFDITNFFRKYKNCNK